MSKNKEHDSELRWEINVGFTGQLLSVTVTDSITGKLVKRSIRPSARNGAEKIINELKKELLQLCMPSSYVS